MNRFAFTWGVAMLASLMACQSSMQQVILENTEGTMRLVVDLDDDGRPFYQLHYLEGLVMDTSYLGLFTRSSDLTEGLTFVGMSGPHSVRDSYEMHHGKQRHITYNAQQYIVTYQNAEGVRLECHFSLSANGMAFRYHLAEGMDTVEIVRENSSFGFPRSTNAWMQPMSKAKSGWRETNPSYEEHYQMAIPVSQKSPIGEGYVFPALFEVDSTWILLSESNVHRNYCGSRLTYDDTLGSIRVTFPQPEEVFPGGSLNPNGTLPFTTPWRTVAIGDLADIVESTLGTDLASPAIAMDTDFISSGLASWSWVLLKDDFTNYETSRRFIDYAAEMQWPYCLIDADWDWKIGYDSMQELVDYASTRNVGILLWYNSSGDWNSTTYTPKSKLVDATQRRAEFATLQQMGVAGCKVDFFGGDGQSMIAYYHDILQDAADHDLMLNFHGATLPRGWHRTYPNLMTVEAIKGEEFVTFEQANADQQPSHCAVIPFTRNVYDPMDFTPMVLDSIPNITRRTTATFELALPILFTSGIQHIAEIPEGMAKMPDEVTGLLNDIPTLWDETRYIMGYPGKEIVIARRRGDTWFIAGINGEDLEKTMEIDLSFANNPAGVLFHDGASEVPESKAITAGMAHLRVMPYGGFVIRI